MKLLVIGSGGREHAIAWKLAQSQSVEKVFVAPGNGGTYREPKIENLSIRELEFESLAEFSKKNNIAYTVVGPEAPLAAGIVDYFQSQNLKILGPSQAAAQLEGSKVFAKEFLLEHNIPTAKAQTFSQIDEAKDFIEHCQFPVVIKADGLAQGKGVVICDNQATAQQTLQDILSDKKFGDAGNQVLIEEFLHGVEVSFMVLCHDQQFVPLATSQDHKARDNGDKGPNTGGMGAYSPAPILDKALYQQVIEQIVQPTLSGMRAKGSPYTGFLYVGLMITPDKQPKVLEYNCRLGDPETQPILFRLKSDFANLCENAIDGKLNEQNLIFDPRIALGVVLAEQGYPGKYDKGALIPSLKELRVGEDHKVFHAGTKIQDGEILTNGGRVLCATALGDNYQEAQDKAYALVKKVAWPSAYYRTDIGYRAIQQPQAEPIS